MKTNKTNLQYVPILFRYGRFTVAFFIVIAIVVICVDHPYVYIVLPLFALCGCFFGKAIFRPKFYAEIDQSGIHILAKKDFEIHMINWDEIHGCYFIKNPSYYFPPYVALVREKGITSKDLFSMRQAYPASELILKYRIDEIMDQLVHGQISKKDFDAQDIYLLSLSEKEYAKLRQLWIRGK